MMLRYFGLYCLAVLACSVSATAADVTVAIQGAPPASSSSYVDSSQPTVSYGTSEKLAISPSTQGWVTFQLGQIPAGVSISNATLTFYVHSQLHAPTAKVGNVVNPDVAPSDTMTWQSVTNTGKLSRTSSAASTPLSYVATGQAFLGDLNSDWVIDAADAGIMFGNWGGSGAGDIDGDGTVDAADAGIMFEHWSDATQVYTYPAGSCTLTCNVTTLIRNMVACPAFNQGFSVRSPNGATDTMWIHSARAPQAQYAPKLTVTYTEPTPTTQRSASFFYGTSGSGRETQPLNCSALEATVDSTVLNNETVAYIFPDHSRIPPNATIVSAALHVRHYKYSNAPRIVSIGIWGTHLNCGNTMPANYLSGDVAVERTVTTGTNNGVNIPTPFDDIIDVKAILQAMKTVPSNSNAFSIRAGEYQLPNYNFVGSIYPSSWQLYKVSEDAGTDTLRPWLQVNWTQPN